MGSVSYMMIVDRGMNVCSDVASILIFAIFVYCIFFF